MCNGAETEIREVPAVERSEAEEATHVVIALHAAAEADPVPRVAGLNEDVSCDSTSVRETRDDAAHRDPAHGAAGDGVGEPAGAIPTRDGHTGQRQVTDRGIVERLEDTAGGGREPTQAVAEAFKPAGEGGQLRHPGDREVCADDGESVAGQRP